MAYALKANVAAGALNTFTTGNIDTSGADFLVANVAWFNSVTNPTISDSNTNSWTGLTAQVNGTVSNRLFYVKNATVGAGHNFTLTGSTIACSVQISAWSGSHLTAPFDQQNGATNSLGTIATGSVTPGEDNELLIAGASSSGGLAFSIDTGFTITNSTAYNSGVNEGGSMAYLIETTAAAKNPTWTITGAAVNAATIATFKQAAAGGSAYTPICFTEIGNWLAGQRAGLVMN